MEVNTELRYHLLKKYSCDPLYKNVILASNQESYEKAKKVLISIRGQIAFNNIKNSTISWFKNKQHTN